MAGGGLWDSLHSSAASTPELQAFHRASDASAWAGGDVSPAGGAGGKMRKTKRAGFMRSRPLEGVFC